MYLDDCDITTGCTVVLRDVPDYVTYGKHADDVTRRRLQKVKDVLLQLTRFMYHGRLEVRLQYSIFCRYVFRGVFRGYYVIACTNSAGTWLLNGFYLIHVCFRYPIYWTNKNYHRLYPVILLMAAFKILQVRAVNSLGAI